MLTNCSPLLTTEGIGHAGSSTTVDFEGNLETNNSVYKLMTKLMFRLGSSLPVFALAVAGQTTMTRICDHTFVTDFQPGHEIRMHLRSGEVRIVGTDAAKITMSCEMKDFSRARDVKITFRATGDSGDLWVSGGPANDFQLRIQVPKKSNLMVRCPAGDLTVEGVTGDKDVELHAGNLDIAVGNATDYRHADASVMAGDLSAPAFAVDKGGLFRSFQKNNPEGKYLLHAHIAAGEITLRN